MFQRGGIAMDMERSANFSDEVTEYGGAVLGRKKNPLNEKVGW